MKRILLVEDDRSLGQTLQERLSKAGYAVELAGSSEQALGLVSDQDLFILDVGLPDGSGFELATSIRAKSASPFIFVTAQSDAESRLRGYEVGAEEYIPKPFHLKEFLLRVRHVLQTHANDERLVVADVTIDFGARRVEFDSGHKEILPQKELELLRLLFVRSPKVVSRDEILNHVWGEDKFPSTRTVDNTVLRLRQILGPKAGACIRTLRGVGYQWESPDEQ
jgi:two-component system phosphate regulon response regulator PhoB